MVPRSKSPLMQGRGLKRVLRHLLGQVSGSPLMQGRGLKLAWALLVLFDIRSPLMQGRGLKLEPGLPGVEIDPSRPSCRGVD